MAAEFNYEELCAALLCLFFSASLNKTQFAKILEFIQLHQTRWFQNHSMNALMQYQKCMITRRLLIKHGIVLHVKISLFYVHSISDYA
jgi:hypothetical protein